MDVFLLGWPGAAMASLVLVTLSWRMVRLRKRTSALTTVASPDDSQLRTAERQILTRELPDVVIHQLSNMALQAMRFPSDSGDQQGLHHVLRSFNRATGLALNEMRLLVRVLRDDPTTASSGDELADLSAHRSPTAVASRWECRLSAAGFVSTMVVPPKADQLEASTQITVARTIVVACDNVLQHAPSRSWFALSVSVTSSLVVVRATSQLPADEANADVLGQSLRSLRARVDLTGGTFSAGSVRSSSTDPVWVVVVAVPRG